MLQAAMGLGGGAGVGGVVDKVVDRLDTDALVKGAAKLVAGILTGDYLTAVGGGLQLLGSVLQLNPAFQTEYQGGKAGTPPPGYASKPQPSAGRTAASDLETYGHSLEVLRDNWETFSNRLSRDVFISNAELKSLAEGKNTAPELKRAAQFLLDHPEYLNRLHAAAPHIFGWEKDDKFGPGELKSELERVQRQLATLPPTRPPSSGPEVQAPITGKPPRPPSGVEKPQLPPVCVDPSPTRPVPGTGSGFSEILNDPRLSIEQKLQRLLMLLAQQTDESLLEVMKELEAANQVTADVVAKGSKATDAEKAQVKRQETSQQFLQLRLQELMERRKAMFELMSNLSSSFHAMARTAISNLGRA